MSNDYSSYIRTYWAYSGCICAAVILPIFVSGMYRRSSLNALLKEGGLLESSPVLVLMTASLLSTVVAFRAKRLFPWGAYAVLCFFLAGEEASWGEDGLLGWHFIAEDEKRPTQDLHNYFSSVLKDLFASSGSFEIPVGIANLITGSVMLMAVLFLITALTLGFFGGGRLVNDGPLRNLKLHSLPLQFVVTGLGLIAFGNIDILQESFGFPYLPGMWPLEESFEVLGSIALLFAAVVKVRGVQD